jgi:hypothetical protein
MSAKENYVTINFRDLTHRAAGQIPSTFTTQCHPLHLHLPHTHPPTSPSPSLQFHNMSPSVPCTELHIQHFLKPSQSLLVRCTPCCYDPHQLNNTFTFTGLSLYWNPWRRITNFSTDTVSGVTNFKYMCSVVLCGVSGLINLSSWLFLWFLICGLVQVLSFSDWEQLILQGPPG